MNIGLISINMYTKGLNFACPLHTYAFQQFLLKNGIESTIINYQPIYYGNFDLRHPYDFYKQVCERRIAENDLEGLDELIEKRDGYQALYKEREVRYDKFQAFIDNNYVKTDKVYTSDLLEVSDPGFDCYICVTDVIWKNEQPLGFDRGFFLGSGPMRNKWKIAYAASRGVYLAESVEDERRFLHYMDDLDFIGVREESLQQYLQQSTDKDVSLVLDPVMLHGRSFYDEMAVEPPEKDYLFLYYVMEQASDTIEQAVAYARAYNLKIVEVTDRPLPNGRLTEFEDVDVTYRYDIGIEEWLGYFKHAKVVFTNSFHATCFSILFEKQFFVGKRSGDKVSNSLKTFGLTNRRFTRNADLAGEDAPDPIDYSLVRPILEEKRASSAAFILDAIHYAETHERPRTNYEWWEREQRHGIVYRTKNLEGVTASALNPETESIELGPDHEMLFHDGVSYVNDGLSRLGNTRFFHPERYVSGWYLRFKIDKVYFWLLENGKFVRMSKWKEAKHGPRKLFAENARIPYIPVDKISNMFAEAQWSESSEPPFIEVIYNSGARNCTFSELPKSADAVELQSGSIEFRIAETWQNNGTTPLLSAPFKRFGSKLVGWRTRVKIDDAWYWFLQNGALAPCKGWDRANNKLRFVAPPEGPVPFVPARNIQALAVEAVWKGPLLETSLPVRGVRYLKRKLAKNN